MEAFSMVAPQAHPRAVAPLGEAPPRAPPAALPSAPAGVGRLGSAATSAAAGLALSGAALLRRRARHGPGAASRAHVVRAGRGGPRQRRTAMRVFDRWREDAITAIYCAQEEAMRQGYGVVCTELVLLGVIAEEQKSAGNRVAKAALTQSGVTREAVRRAVTDLKSTRGEAKEGSGRGSSLPFSDNAKRIFDQANLEAKSGDVGCEHLLLAMAQEEGCGGLRVLAEFGVDGDKLRAAVDSALSGGEEKQLAAVGASGGDKKTTLDEVATDLTQMALDGLLDPVVGRDAEMDRVIQILLRKRKNNACLVGPPGVGKTAIAEGLAQKIVSGDVPASLKGTQVYSLDLGLVVAGTKYRGEFEERLKSVIQEVTNPDRDICLFIDEIHQLVGAGVAGGDASMDAANLLKPALARGELQVIGATTLDEYVKYIEKDGALERRFQKVACEEPTVLQTIDILDGLRGTYEQHHNVLLTKDAIVAAARLSDRYINDRFLPDKAIDLIDEAGSLVQLRVDSGLEKAADGETDPDAIRRPLVTANDIAYVTSRWCGVPVERLTEDEASRLLRLEDTLHERIVGQKEAVNALGRAVRRARAGLAGASRPIASMYFAGPTGVGKTELCKVLAATYYSSEKAMIRLDMSEYAESHSVARLVGPPPGYVGYDDPRSGQLTESVRRKPHSVVVLDEIEKAHPEVMNLLLQVLEDGRLTDGKGRTVSFSNTIIIMTSNVGSREILAAGAGAAGYAQMRAAVQTQLKQKFRPEFLNRIDELLVFRALDDQEMREITKLGLRDASHRVAAAHDEAAMMMGGTAESLEVEWTQALEDAVLARGSDRAYGARSLRRAVQRLFEDPLAEMMVDGSLSGAVSVDIEDGDIVVNSGGRSMKPQLAAAMSMGIEVLKGGSSGKGPPEGKAAPVAAAVS